jgi:hypothetical protein
VTAYFFVTAYGSSCPHPMRIINRWIEGDIDRERERRTGDRDGNYPSDASLQPRSSREKATTQPPAIESSRANPPSVHKGEAIEGPVRGHIAQNRDIDQAPTHIISHGRMQGLIHASQLTQLCRVDPPYRTWVLFLLQTARAP